jgi:tRNA-uridine 2-sulfurtransferase
MLLSNYSPNKSPNKTPIVTGMSGGVDSSVAAYLLQQQGYAVSGLFMKNWEEDDTADFCSAAVDLKDAQAISEQLQIPLHTVNFASEYWEQVFSHFLAEYQAGRTPNPDVLCNREIKFNVFLEHALSLGGEFIATGHYARVRKDEQENYVLLKGCDPDKDQSYFLHLLTQKQLAKSHFPLGELHKTQVRQIAREIGLATQDKKDSTGLCFIGERPFRAFLARFLPAQTGEIVTQEGVCIGEHQGAMYYTIGQRQGLHIGGLAQGSGEAWYVAAKEVAHNRLIVVQGSNHPALFSRSLYANEIHWISGHPPTFPLHCTAKTRYRQVDQPCFVMQSENGVQVQFEQPQRAITPGQSIVFYQDDQCLGGGIIIESI